MIAALAASAAADPKTNDANDTPPAVTAGTTASADVHAGTGVEHRVLIGEAAEFTAGTKVWVWSRITGGEPGTMVTHVWKRDGKAVWTAHLAVGSKKWTTYSRRTLKAGAWTVDVVDAGGATIGTVAFTVK